MSEPIFCVPPLTRAELITELQRDLDSLPYFSRRANYTSAEESMSVAQVSVEARLDTLLHVYKGEYHTDSFDFDRVAKRIRDGQELIWFWGATDQIATLRTAFTTGRYDAEQISLGTVTLTSAEDEFGQGYGESCRSGSVATKSGAKAAFMTRLLDFMTGDLAVLHDRYHSIISATRNCPKRSSTDGGEAIHQISKRYVRSRFWGYLPWYVMSGGVLELLELREANRDPADVLHSLNSTTPWFFADQNEAAYAQALAAVSFETDINVNVVSEKNVQQAQPFQLLKPTTEDLMRYNHGSLVQCPESDSTSVDLEDGISHLENLEVSCIAVHVALDAPETVGVQQELLRRGFRLGAIVPPKKSWIRSLDGLFTHIATGPIGIWNRPRKDLAIVPPYYLDKTPLTGAENTILEYVRSCLLN